VKRKEVDWVLNGAKKVRICERCGRVTARAVTPLETVVAEGPCPWGNPGSFCSISTGNVNMQNPVF